MRTMMRPTTSTSSTAAATSTAAAAPTAALPPARFHWWATLASFWIISGLFLDGWYHIHYPENESFFTPWHGILYSGVGVAVAVILNQILRTRRSGVPFRQAVPPGYGLSIVGGVLVLVAGTWDGLWHEILGIEVGVEALLSPPHLTLALAGALVFAGPVRALWQQAGGVAPWPAILSTAVLLSLLGFFTQYVSPIAHLYPTAAAPVDQGPDLLHAAGIAAIVIHAAMITGAVLLLTLRWRLPFGAVTAILVVLTSYMATQRGTYLLIPAAIVGGLAIDALLAWRHPSRSDVGATRLVAVTLPAIVTTGIMLTFLVAGTLEWSVPLVTGAIAVSGAVGALLSVLAVPPALPAPPDGTSQGYGSDAGAADADERAAR
jgi:hypothetical protein